MSDRAETPAHTSSDGAAGDALWDDWDAPPRVPSMPVLHLDGFNGPMDLLLELAERQRIDLGRISIQALAEQFAAALERLAEHVPIERRADWLVLATRLVLLRARLMFPGSPAAAEAAARDATTELQRLDDLQFARAAGAWLQARPQLGLEVFTRPRRGPDPRVASYMALMEACLVLLRGGEGQPADEADSAYRLRLPDLWRVPDALDRIRRLLAEHPEGGDLVRFLPSIAAGTPDGTLKARAAMASTFVAGLELAREGEIGLDQAAVFAPVFVRGLVQRNERGDGRTIAWL